MHLSVVSINPTSGVPNVYHVEGDVVELKNDHARDGRRHYVRSAGGGGLFELTDNWRPSKAGSLYRAAEQLEDIARGLVEKAAELRQEAKTSAAPGTDGGCPLTAAGRAQAEVAT